jgi:hypothetical protein
VKYLVKTFLINQKAQIFFHFIFFFFTTSNRQKGVQIRFTSKRIFYTDICSIKKAAKIFGFVLTEHCGIFGRLQESKNLYIRGIFQNFRETKDISNDIITM